ncbi:MAG: hypothetical protein GQ564_12855 [Bacteroidales bacterium]|nr:hypothetical protein [Bacteroidales bacterium]
MNAEIEKLVAKIENNINNEDFIEVCEEYLEKLEELDFEGSSIESLLKIIEDNPNIELGMPGPIVHFVERFFRKGYEEKLIKSIERKPRAHTLWMLNRIINGVKDNEREDYITIMKNILTMIDIDNEVKNAALRFCELYD